jgi:hypothetical protein
MKSRLVIILSLILIAGATGCATSQPIQNIVDRPVPANVDGSARALDEVRAAIIKGCEAKKWSAVMDGEARTKCSILVRGRHYAEVIIPYSSSAYSIYYSDSRVLDYDEKDQSIHRNYNKWVILLSQAIQSQFSGGDTQRTTEGHRER